MHSVFKSFYIHVFQCVVSYNLIALGCVIILKHLWIFLFFLNLIVYWIHAHSGTGMCLSLLRCRLEFLFSKSSKQVQRPFVWW